MTIAMPETAERHGILTLLRHNGERRGASARKITESVLADPALAASETLTELAERAGVSESSIVRFVRQQGFRRFQEFKVALAFDAALEAAQQRSPPRRDQPRSLQQLLHTAVRSLEQTHLFLDAQELAVVAERLARADQVLAFGAGASGTLALAFQYKLVRLGLKITAAPDMHLAAMQATLLGSRGVAIAISRSGATTDTLRTLQLARQQGAATVLITSKPRSSAAQDADHVLLAVGAESPIEGGTLTSELSTLFLLSALHASLVERLPQAEATLLRTAQATADKRE